MFVDNDAARFLPRSIAGPLPGYHFSNVVRRREVRSVHVVCKVPNEQLWRWPFTFGLRIVACIKWVPRAPVDPWCETERNSSEVFQ